MAFQITKCHNLTFWLSV